jgi:hypothetical protein
MKFYMADGNTAINLRLRQDAGHFGETVGAGEVAIHEVRLHLSAASAAEDFIVAIDSGVNTRYDQVLDTKAMNGLADYVYKPDIAPEYIRAGDDILITKTNAAGLTWSLVVVYE